MIRKDIEAVLRELPELSLHGIRVYEGTALGGGGDVTGDKEQLLRSSALCAAVCVWLSTLDRRKTINPYHTSYGYKHMAEMAIEEYVPNGVLIAAAIHCGFRYRICKRSPNVKFNISERSLKRYYGAV